MPGKLRRIAASGRAKKPLFDLLLQLVPARQHRGELHRQFANQSSSCGGASDRDRLCQRSRVQLLGKRLRSTHTLRLQRSSELVNTSLFDGWSTRVLLQDGQYTAAIQPLTERSLESRPMCHQQVSKAVGQAVGIGAQIGVIAAQQLQMSQCLTARLEPHHASGMRTSDVGEHERVFRIGLALASIEIACARMARPCM